MDDAGRDNSTHGTDEPDDLFADRTGMENNGEVEGSVPCASFKQRH